MSLVNKMLRDLDARRAGDAERGTLPAAVTPLEPPAGSSRRGVVLGAAAVLAVAGAGAAAYYLGVLPAPPGLPSPPAFPAPAAIPAQAPLAPAAVAPAPTFPPAAAVAPMAPAVAVAGSPALKLDIDLAKLPEAKPIAMAAKPPATAKPAKPASPAPAVAPPAPAPAALPAAATDEPRIDKQSRQPSAAERAQAEFRRGQLAQRQGAADEAMVRYRAALAEQPEHVASRQALAGLLIERRHYDDAEEALRRGLALFPRQPYWPMTLARLRVERGDAPAALDILQRQAAAGEASADYQGFHGALLQRLGRAAEAIERYAAATRLAPNEARWWAGLGIALEGSGRAAEARNAFERARGLPGLPAELAAHIEQRLR
jgi:MSHA biogenesis protein MshN